MDRDKLPRQILTAWVYQQKSGDSNRGMRRTYGASMRIGPQIPSVLPNYSFVASQTAYVLASTSSASMLLASARASTAGRGVSVYARKTLVVSLLHATLHGRLHALVE